MLTTSIEDRLARLERQNQRLRILMLALIVIAAGGMLLSSVRPVRAQAPAWKRTVEAEGFVLRDANGRVRAVLDMSAGWPGLVLFDSSGRPVIGLEGTPVGQEISLGTPGGEEAILGVTKGGAGLTFSDRPFHPNVKLEGSADSSSLTLKDSGGFESVIGHTALTTPATGEKSQSSAASIHLFNKKGNVIWAAPLAGVVLPQRLAKVQKSVAGGRTSGFLRVSDHSLLRARSCWIKSFGKSPI